jgi:hypothetical protein
MPICFGCVDLDWFARHREVNYLHSGDTLDTWTLRHDLVAAANQLHACANHRGRCSKILPFRRNSKLRQPAKEQRWADPDRLAQALSESVNWRREFHRLGSRGFSYQLDVGMSRYNSLRVPAEHLSSRIDLRLALMPNRELFYPSAVSRYLDSRRWRSNHYNPEGVPSIAFCFGRTIGRTWYVLSMQSDLSCSAPSAVREHFRGWRNILFANIVAQAKGNADRVRICLANDVVRGCFPGTRETAGPSARWSSIYDGTARDWQMRAVTTRVPIDIQLYRRQQPIFANRFHQLTLRRSRSNQVVNREGVAAVPA